MRRVEAEKRPRAWRFVVHAVVHVVVIIAACFAIHRLCVIPFRDNRTMREVEERMAVVQSVDPVRAQPLARANLADLDRVARSRRLDAAWYLFYGANCEILERWQDAADAYTRALAIDQRPELYFSRGLVMLHLGRIDQAAEDMITAVRFNPFLLDQIGGELRARVAAGAGLS
jgi:tetratricopeptide (TPR) repeat protein